MIEAILKQLYADSGDFWLTLKLFTVNMSVKDASVSASVQRTSAGETLRTCCWVPTLYNCSVIEQTCLHSNQIGKVGAVIFLQFAEMVAICS